MYKSVFKINKMDCPSEEQLIRLKLQSYKNIYQLVFDINNRILSIYHDNNTNVLLSDLNKLNLDTKLIEDSIVNNVPNIINEQNKQLKLFVSVLIINFIFFIIEIIAAYYSNSVGLFADSLDMLADAFVYFLAIIAIFKSQKFKKNIANLAGTLQLTLAIFGFWEVIKRFFFTTYIPSYSVMIMISFLALIANIISYFILNKNKQNEIHIKASLIFTSNDIIANIGVIVAAVFVNIFNSYIPDLIIGSIVFYLVLKGAINIYKL